MRIGVYRRVTKVIALGLGWVIALSAPAAGQDDGPSAADVPALIGAIEERAYAAWKAHDTEFWTDALSERFVGWGASGPIDKRQAIPTLSGANCRIAGFKLANLQVTRLTPDAALLTHKTEVDGACDGRPAPAAAYTLTIYVRENGRWKIGYRAQSAIVDPMKAARPSNSDLWTGGPTRTDADTQSLLAREQTMVSAWKDRDTAGMAAIFGPSIQFVDIFGNHIGTRAEALKAWSGEGCDVKGFEFSGAKATMFTPGFGALTYRAIYDAKCFGQDVWPIWGTAFYVKHGDAWLWSSGINVLAGADPG